VDTLLKEARAVPRAVLLAALGNHLPGLMFEARGRVHSCAARGSRHDLRLVAAEVVLEAVTALCLLNGAWVRHDYFEAVRDAARFPLVPERFVEESERLWLCDDPGQATALVDRYLRSVLLLLEREGIPVPAAPAPPN
jgi:hypothetical protein